MHKSKHI